MFNKMHSVGAYRAPGACRRVSFHTAEQQSTTGIETQSLTERRVSLQWLESTESWLAMHVILSQFDGTNHERSKNYVKTDYNERSGTMLQWPNDYGSYAVCTRTFFFSKFVLQFFS